MEYLYHLKQATPPPPEHKHCPSRPVFARGPQNPSRQTRARPAESCASAQSWPATSRDTALLTAREAAWRRARTAGFREGRGTGRPHRAPIAFVGTRHTSPVRMFLAMSPFDVNVGARRAMLCHVVDSLVPELPLRISYGQFFASSLNHFSTVQPPSSSVSFVRSNSGLAKYARLRCSAVNRPESMTLWTESENSTFIVATKGSHTTFSANHATFAKRSCRRRTTKKNVRRDVLQQLRRVAARIRFASIVARQTCLDVQPLPIGVRHSSGLNASNQRPTLSARMSNYRTTFSSGKKSLARAHMRASKSNKRTITPCSPTKKHVVVRCTTVQADHELLHPRWFGRFRTALACGHESALVTWQSTRALRSVWLGLLLAGATGCGLQSESIAPGGRLLL